MQNNSEAQILVQFKSETGELLDAPIDLPQNITVQSLGQLCNALQKNDPSEAIPFTFFINGNEIVSDLRSSIENLVLDHEKVLEVIYQPQAVFRVRPVTRCTR